MVGARGGGSIEDRQALARLAGVKGISHPRPALLAAAAGGGKGGGSGGRKRARTDQAAKGELRMERKGAPPPSRAASKQASPLPRLLQAPPSSAGRCSSCRPGPSSNRNSSSRGRERGSQQEEEEEGEGQKTASSSSRRRGRGAAAPPGPSGGSRAPRRPRTASRSSPCSPPAPQPFSRPRGTRSRSRQGRGGRLLSHARDKKRTPFPLSRCCTRGWPGWAWDSGWARRTSPHQPRWAAARAAAVAPRRQTCGCCRRRTTCSSRPPGASRASGGKAVGRTTRWRALPPLAGHPDSLHFGAFERHTTGFGSRMLQRMGFEQVGGTGFLCAPCAGTLIFLSRPRQGKGLGKDGSGRTTPILPEMRPKRQGLGAD